MKITTKCLTWLGLCGQDLSGLGYPGHYICNLVYGNHSKISSRNSLLSSLIKRKRIFGLLRRSFFPSSKCQDWKQSFARVILVSELKFVPFWKKISYGKIKLTKRFWNGLNSQIVWIKQKFPLKSSCSFINILRMKRKHSIRHLKKQTVFEGKWS